MEKLSAEECHEFDDRQQFPLDAESLISDFYQFSEKPFEDNPDPKFLYLTPSYQKIFTSILAWIKEGNGYAVITGEAGTGKTFFIHALTDHLEQRVTPVLVPNPVTTFEDLLKAILLILKQPTQEDSETGLFHRFKRLLDQMVAQDKTLLIILDEAQGFNDRILNDIERLLNLRSKPIRVIFVGLPYFDKKLNSMGFGRLGQKIEVKQKIRPFTENESRGYIDHRLRLVGGSSEIMTPKAISLICSYAQGTASLINHVCDIALWVGCRMGCKEINVEVIEKVIQNLEGSKILPKILLSIELTKRIRKYPVQISVSFKEVLVALFHKFIQNFPRALLSIQFAKRIWKVPIQFTTSVKRTSTVLFLEVAQNLGILPKGLPSIQLAKGIWEFLIQFAISFKRVSIALLKGLKIFQRNLALIRPFKRIWKSYTQFAFPLQRVSVTIFLLICLGGIILLLYEYVERRPTETKMIGSFVGEKLATRPSTHKPSVGEKIEGILEKSKTPTSDKPKLTKPVSSSREQDTVLLTSRKEKQRPIRVTADESLNVTASVRKEESLHSFEISSKTNYPDEAPKLREVSKTLENQGLTITHFFAPDKGPYGCIWQIYIEAESSDGGMDRISVEVDQVSYGRYPTEWIKINPRYREHLKGFLQWNTFSSKAPNLPEGTEISAKISIYDKAGNKSNEVMIPLTFGSGVTKRYQLPTPFDEGDIPRIGYVMIDLCNTSF